MSSDIFVAVLLATFGSILIARNSHALRIEVKEHLNGTCASSIEISCVLDSTGSREVFLLQIEKDGEKPMVYLQRGSAIQYGDHTPGVYQDLKAVGSIEVDPSRSHLSATFCNPKIENIGEYTCVVYYISPLGQLEKERDSVNITQENFDINGILQQKVDILEKKLKDQAARESKMMEKVTKLEEQLQNHSKQITSMDNEDSTMLKKVDLLEDAADKVIRRVSALKDFTRIQSQEIESLADKVTFTSAFSAYSNGDINISKGKTVIFPDVIMKLGQCYNETTGVFVAPRAGLYAFHLVLLNRCYYCYRQVDLMVNDDVMVSLYAGDRDNHDQSSVSSLGELKHGDEVRAVSKSDYVGSKLSFFPYKYSVFTGYLIRAL